MTGIGIGALLAAAALAWVLAPIVRGSRAEPVVSSSGDPAERCPACGRRPEAGASFCSNCGRALT